MTIKKRTSKRSNPANGQVNKKVARNIILPKDFNPKELYAKRLLFHEADRRARRDLDEREAQEKAIRLMARMPQTESLTAFLNRPKPPREWTVPGVWERDTTLTLAAEYKSGKTVLVMNVMRSLCDGVPFLGREVTAHGGIWFWNCELSEQQCDDWFRDIDIDNTARLHVLNLRGVQIPDLRTEAGKEWAANELARRRIKHWFIDPWRRICTEENNNDLADEIFQALEEIKRMAGGDIDLWINHHFGRPPKGKNGDQEVDRAQERGRGATVVDDRPDARMVLVVVGNDRFFRADRGRDTDFPETKLIYNASTRHLDVGEGNRSDAKRRQEAGEIELMAVAVTDMVRKFPAMNARGIRGKFTDRKSLVDAGRDRAEATGRIENRGTERAHAWYAI